MPHRVAQASKIGKITHAQSIKFGFFSNGPLPNAIIDLYAKCGNVEFAEKAFGRLEKRDILAWNSVLSMYSKRGMLEDVVNCFVSLQSSGDGVVFPNEFTFSIVLSACSRLVNLAFGKQIHCCVVKMGLETSSFSGGALIDMYAKCNCLTDARQVFDGTISPDTVSWTSMIAGYVQVGMPEEALEVFDNMEKEGHVPDQVAIVTIINACMSLGRLADARTLFAQLSNPNVIAWNVMISGHAKRGFPGEATKFFENMRKSGVNSTRSTLGSVLSAIASLAALESGLFVHAEAIKQGLSSNVYVRSSLINMYAKCKKMDFAKKVFDELDERNVVLWNAMLGGYAQNGQAEQVMGFFSDMKVSGFQPDDFTYTSVLSACSSLGNLDTGRQMHSVIIKNRFASNLFVGNALVDMYAKSGAVEEARQQFERIKDPDNVSWNAIIVGYVQEEEEMEAFNMFRRMNSNGFMPDEVSTASILSACANIRGLNEGKQIHCLSVKSGLKNSLYAGSALVDMYAKCGVVEEAYKALSSMPERSMASINAMISGYAKHDLERALDLFQEMQIEGLKPSEVTLTSLLDACDGPHMLNLGRQIHSLVLKRGLLYDEDFLGVSLLGMYMNAQRNTEAELLFSDFTHKRSAIIWTAMISMLTQNDRTVEALLVFSEMRSYNALPDQATFVSVLRACALLSSLQEGRKIHSLIYHTGYDLDELTASSLIDMYAKCGDVMSSANVFKEMSYRDDVISWNSMIVGFAKNGYAEGALRVFIEMKQTYVVPDDVTFLGVLTACSHAGRVSEGREIFDAMVNYYRIKPRVDHCACMVDLLGRWGSLKEAEDFIDGLKVEADAMIWATMLAACRIHGDEIRGRKAAEKLISLEPQNSSPYVLLSNIYAASGNWDEVNALRRAMREKGVRKLPGCSWIVVGQKTDMFVAGDKFHPQADEIYVVLKHLMALMKDDGHLPDMDLFLHDEN